MDVNGVIEAQISVDTVSSVSHQPQQANGDNKFSKAISSWRNIDLTSLLPQLDQIATEILSNQKDVLVERKDVAQRTKDFRKLDDTGKLAEHKTLLKSYQSFIDTLTTHQKTASSAFLQLYTPLSDAPDPFPLLEASVESLVLAEDTLPRLTSENRELQKRVERLTSQLDDAEKRVQSESKTRQESDANLEKRVHEIEATWLRALQEKEDNWLSKERVFEEKIENQERLLRELKASYEVSDRLDRSNIEGSDTLNRAASAELALATSDLEKTTARLSEIEARNEELRLELARASSHTSRPAGEDAVVITLRAENSTLLRQLESMRFDRNVERNEWNSRIKHTDRQRDSLLDETQSLKAKLLKHADYEEIKRELNILKTIELSVANEQEDEVDGSKHSGQEKKNSLEQLLLTRNKKLSDELTMLRVSHRDLQEQLDTMQADLTRANIELNDSQSLSSKLESDLLRVQEEAADGLPSSGMSVAGTYTTRYQGSSRRGRSSPTSSIISGFDGQSRLGSTTLEALRSGDPVGGGSGILPMVQAQRDRFKQKNAQLEEELQKSHGTVSSLRQEIASLQRDNLNLYEKTRYVSTYNRGNIGSSSNSYSQAPTHVAISSIADDEADTRWKSQYEAHVSPFAAFRGREMQKQVRRMTVVERLMLSVTRIVLATRTSRNFFGAYLCGLHILVLCMLWASASTSQSLSPLGMANSVPLADTGLLKDTT